MYRSIARCAERFIQRRICVNNYLYHCVAASKYTAAEGEKDKPCEHCNGRLRLCIRVIMNTMGPKLCIFPLHDRYRNRQNWASIDVYVRPDGVIKRFCARDSET